MARCKQTRRTSLVDAFALGGAVAAAARAASAAKRDYVDVDVDLLDENEEGEDDDNVVAHQDKRQNIEERCAQRSESCAQRTESCAQRTEWHNESLACAVRTIERLHLMTSPIGPTLATFMAEAKFESSAIAERCLRLGRLLCRLRQKSDQLASRTDLQCADALEQYFTPGYLRQLKISREDVARVIDTWRSFDFIV